MRFLPLRLACRSSSALELQLVCFQWKLEQQLLKLESCRSSSNSIAQARTAQARFISFCFEHVFCSLTPYVYLRLLIFSHRCAACVIMGAWSMLPYSTALKGLSKCKYLSHTCKHLYSLTVAHADMMLRCSYPGPSLQLLTRGQCACLMFNCFHYNTSTEKHRSSHVFTLCDGFD